MDKVHIQVAIKNIQQIVNVFFLVLTVICVWRTLYIVNIHCAGLPHCARHTVYHTTHTTQIGSVWLRYPCEVGQEHNMAQLGKRPVIICGQWTTVCNDNCEAEKLVEKLCGQLATCTKTRAHIWWNSQRADITRSSRSSTTTCVKVYEAISKV